MTTMQSGGITLGGYNPTTANGENWLMILPGITANTPRVLIGASTVDDGTSALQVNGDSYFNGNILVNVSGTPTVGFTGSGAYKFCNTQNGIIISAS